MNLKNYSSEVPATRTISYIEAYLAEAGVSGIAKEIENRAVRSLMFSITIAGVNGGAKTYTIRLPAKIDEVQEFLFREYLRGSVRPKKTKDDFLGQAERTAWKLQFEWVQIQLSFIRLKQADFLQVFMGYVWDGGQTYYDFIKGQNFKALPERTE